MTVERKLYRLRSFVPNSVQLMPRDWEFRSIYTQNPHEKGRTWELATLKPNDHIYLVKIIPGTFLDVGLVTYKDMIGKIGVPDWHSYFVAIEEGP